MKNYNVENFDFDKVFKIIGLLQTINGYAYDIHYSSSGSLFYEEHLLSERVGDSDEIYDFKDDVIETVYLGRGKDAPLSEEISEFVSKITPELTDSSDKNFKNLRDLISYTLVEIETLENLSRGEEDLFGSIAHVLQRHNGLLFKQLDYSADELNNSNDGWKHLLDI